MKPKKGTSKAIQWRDREIRRLVELARKETDEVGNLREALTETQDKLRNANETSAALGAALLFSCRRLNDGVFPLKEATGFIEQAYETNLANAGALRSLADACERYTL